jgi:hypothetical protein
MIQEPDQPQPPADDRGVFGNLPSARPGVRSPRRDSKAESGPKPAQSKDARGKPSARAGASAPRPSAPRRAQKPAPPPPPPASSTEPPRAPSPAESAPSESGRGGVEEVAWAGITVAAEAATLGVRLFSRALEAVRERR